MSGKTNKLIRRYLKMTGMNKTGEQWRIPIGFNEKGKAVSTYHVLRDDKRIKNAYKQSNYKGKFALRFSMLQIIKLQNEAKKIKL